MCTATASAVRGGDAQVAPWELGVGKIQRKSRVRERTHKNAPQIRAGVEKGDQKAELKKEPNAQVLQSKKNSIFPWSLIPLTKVHFDHNKNGMVIFCTSGKFRSNVLHFAKFRETDGGGADGELVEARRAGWACRRL